MSNGGTLTQRIEHAIADKGLSIGDAWNLLGEALEYIERLEQRAPDRADVDQRWVAGTDAREVWRLLQEYRRRSVDAAGSREQSDVDGWLQEQLRPMMKEPA